jgi:glycosyltransferase involved in cell wall biosynthesis
MNSTPLDRPLRLAVYFDQKLHVGGGYQQALNAALLAQKIPADLCETVFFTPIKENIRTLQKFGIEAKFISLNPLAGILLRLRGLIKHTFVLTWVQAVFGLNRIEKTLCHFKVDLVYFLAPTAPIRSLEKLNYITTVWDLCHRDDLEFPEVRANLAFEGRELLYRSTLAKAVAIIADSDIGKENIVRRYGIDEDRVYVLPFSPAAAIEFNAASLASAAVDIKKEFSIQGEYIFYPAQFWPHKNHVYILEALYLLEKKFGKKVTVIFSGGDVDEHLAYIKQISRQLNLDDRVRFAGFVDHAKMPHLYLQSLALVMPTYFGPTNLPPLEAFRLGVPVIYSDKRGLKDQVGDAAILIDLGKPDTLTTALLRLLEDESLRDSLISKGRRRLLETTDEERVDVLVTIVKEFRVRRKCWL